MVSRNLEFVGSVAAHGRAKTDKVVVWVICVDGIFFSWLLMM